MTRPGSEDGNAATFETQNVNCSKEKVDELPLRRMLKVDERRRHPAPVVERARLGAVHANALGSLSS